LFNEEYVEKITCFWVLVWILRLLIKLFCHLHIIFVKDFYFYIEIETITLPEGMTAVGERAFSGNFYIKSVILPESMTSIERYAFNGCSGLASINFPNGLVSIGNDAFNGCKLENLDLPVRLIISHQIFCK